MLHLPHASQLTCFRHLQQNAEQYLKDKQFPVTAVKEYIFGWRESDDTVHEGLVDSSNVEKFKEHLSLIADQQMEFFGESCLF